MKVITFHPMPYRYLLNDFERQHHSVWVDTSNSLFLPREELRDLSFADSNSEGARAALPDISRIRTQKRTTGRPWPVPASSSGACHPNTPKILSQLAQKERG